MMILHGQNDHTVPFDQGERLHDKMEELGCDVTLIALETQITQTFVSSRTKSGR